MIENPLNEVDRAVAEAIAVIVRLKLCVTRIRVGVGRPTPCKPG